MGLFDDLLGGGERRPQFEDFVSRYEQGRPDEGYDDDEVASRYSEVAGEVDEDTYRESARESFARLDPQDRAQFGQSLFQTAQERGIAADYDGSDDPESLARLTSSVHRQSPDLLGALLGGGRGSMGGMGGLGGGLGGLGGLGGMGGLGGLGGLLGGGMGGMGGGNPMARAVLAGITAMAARRMMSR